MSQRATSFIINCGPSMQRKLSGHDKTAFQEGMEIIIDSVGEKILANRKTDKMNVIFSGTKDTNNELNDENPEQYQHVTTVGPIGQPNIDLLRHLVNQTSDISGTKADIMDALILAIHIIVKNFAHLRYAKQIVLITDSADYIDWRDVETVLNMLRTQDIKLVVIGVDFDADGVTKKEEGVDQVTIKETNQKEWKNLAQGVDDARIYSLQEAYESAKGMKAKEVKPTTSFRGCLNIGDTINHTKRSVAINVHMYPYVMEAKAPPTQKWSTLSNLAQSDNQDGPSTSNLPPLSHAVQMIRKYVVKNSDTPDEPSPAGTAKDGDTPMEDSQPGTRNNKSNEVDANVLEKVYPFGKTLVKISADEEAYLKLDTSPGMWVYGFLSKSAVPRDYFLSRVYLVMGDPANKHATGLAIGSLARALYEKDAVALVRFVRRQNAEPEMGILSPFIDVDVNLLQFCQIPFAEDVRQFTFSSLDKITTKSGKVIEENHPLLPTPEMTESMTTFVKMMQLNTGNEDHYTPEDTFNPLIWRYNTAIKTRALNEAAPIPKVHPRLEQDMSVLPKLEEKCADQVKKMASLFNVKKVEDKTLKKRRYGADSSAESVADTSERAPIEQVMAGTEGQEPKRTRSQDTLNQATKKVEQLTIGTSDPVKDFNAMLDNEEDLVTAAVTQMTDLVLRLAMTSFGDQHYNRIVTCLKACREASAKENEAGLFNSCMYQLKQLINPSKPTSPRLELWQLLQKESISLISKDEAEDDEVAHVTKEDADKFLNDVEQDSQPTKMQKSSTDANNEMSTEDLLAMME